VIDSKLSPTAGSKAQQSVRRSDIQGIRAVAVILVVAFHAGLPVPGGYVGVDIFFVISGFVITAMLLREKLASGRISLRSFYIRRFRRLTPALAVMVAFTILLSALPIFSLASQEMTAATAIGAMFLFANYAIARTTGGYFDPAAEHNLLLHTWSLSVEEQFYLVFPVLIMAAWVVGRRFRRPRLAVAIVVTVLGAISLSVALATAVGFTLPLVPDGLVGFYGPIGRAWEFAAGAILAVVVPYFRQPSRRVALVTALAGVAFLAFSVFAFSDATVFPSASTLVPVLGTTLLLFAGQYPANAVSRALSAGPMVKLGDLSYSWYLWHWPVIVLAITLLPGDALAPIAAAVLSLVFAYVSYRFVEQPYRTGAGSTRWRLTALVAVSLIVPVGLAGVLTHTLNNGYWSPPVERMQATQAKHAGNVAGCMSYVPLTTSTQASCEWNAAATGKPIYLIGDSIADHYSEALIGASENLKRPLFMATAAGCPAYRVVLLLPLEDAPADVTERNGCGSYIDGTLDWLEEQPPGLVVMGASDVSGWAPNDLPDTNAVTAGDRYSAKSVAAFNARKQAAVLAGMTSTMKRLKAAGHEVAIAQAPPSYRFPAPSWLPGDCSVATVMAEECSTTRSVAEMDDLQRPTREAVVEAASLSSGVVLDLRDYFCDADRCVTQHGKVGLYLDDIHISVTASKDLIPWFTEFVAAQD
jgi:peptidoglycan/LPS O-acetylase OafA/YrhL